ncbi:16870_t:CDS:1, partial [Racocetra fulgida]
MTQIAAEMKWEERLEDINKIRKTVTTNSVINPINEASALSSTIDLSEIINVSMLDNGEVDIEEINDETINSDDIDE